MPQELRELFAYDASRPLLFTSGQFLLWLTLLLPCFAWLVRRPRARLWLLTAFSCFFYYKTSGGFLLALLLTAVIDHRIALELAHSASPLARKRWLWLSIALSAGVLVYFKYSMFVAGGLASLVGKHFEPLDLVAPAGISFYTFESISYVVDVYRGRLAPVRRLVDYVAYLAYFPHLVAGPIVRAEELVPSLQRPAPLDGERLGSGLFLLLSGLFKKAILADYLARFVDPVFAGGAGLSGFEVLLGLYAYAAQIYCDFAGYSEMALGLGRLTGVELPINFRAPYAAGSLSEFWRRWHISLSSWLRDYVYLPLGGNRRGPLRTAFNLLATMLLGGFWHGASLAFLGWGLAHGLGLVLEKAWPAWLPRLRTRPLRMLLTFHVVVLLWIPFRAGSLDLSFELLRRVATDFQLEHCGAVLRARAWLLVAIAGGLGLGALSLEPIQGLARRFARAPLAFRAAFALGLVQLALELRSSDVQPFIYFQF